MIEDRELDAWREQWSSVAEPSADFQRDFQRKVQQRIKREDRRFVLGNLLTVIAFLGILIFAWYMRHQSSWMGTGWATSICVLVFVSAGFGSGFCGERGVLRHSQRVRSSNFGTKEWRLESGCFGSLPICLSAGLFFVRHLWLLIGQSLGRTLGLILRPGLRC